jgi:hypothetical protein
MAETKRASERQAQRARYRARAIASAERMGVTQRCASLLDDMDNPGHRLCRGEDPGNAGCLCRCHDERTKILT